MFNKIKRQVVTQNAPIIRPKVGSERRFKEFLQLAGGGDLDAAARLAADTPREVYLYPESGFKNLIEGARLLSDLVTFRLLTTVAAAHQAEALALKHPDQAADLEPGRALLAEAAAYWAGFKLFCSQNSFDQQGFFALGTWQAARPRSWSDEAMGRIIEDLERVEVSTDQIKAHLVDIQAAWESRELLQPEVKHVH